MLSTLLTRSRNSRSNKSVHSFTSTNTYSKISGSLADSITRIYASFAFSIRTFYSNRFLNTPRILSDNLSTSFLVVSKPFSVQEFYLLILDQEYKHVMTDDLSSWFVHLVVGLKDRTNTRSEQAFQKFATFQLLPWCSWSSWIFLTYYLHFILYIL